MLSVPFLIDTLSPRYLKDSLTSGISIFQIICGMSRGCRSSLFRSQMSWRYICNIGVQFCFCTGLCEFSVFFVSFKSLFILFSIRNVVHAKHKQWVIWFYPRHATPHLMFSLCRFEALDDSECSAVAAKCYELCNAAANHITSIGKSLEFASCRYLS